MATLSQYLDVDGYVLHVTSEVPSSYAEATSTLTLGNQTATATPGTFTDTGIARGYAIVDPIGETIIESGAIPPQPVKQAFSWQVAGFENGPKIIPEGVGDNFGNAPVWARRLRGLRKAYTGRTLNRVLERALDRVEVKALEKAAQVRKSAPAEAAEKIAQIAYEQTFADEVAKVVDAPEIVQALAPSQASELRQSLERQRREAKARVAKLLASKVVEAANDDEAERQAMMAQDEADALQALEVLFATLDDDDDEEDEAA